MEQMLHAAASGERPWEQLTEQERARALWPEGPPRDAWHSFDRTPWKHPWVTADHLREFRAFSDAWLEQAVERFRRRPDRGGCYGFVCNIANNLYGRARALQGRMGGYVDTVLHPFENFVMSQPGWEEYAGTMPEGVVTTDQALERGIRLPQMPAVFRQEVTSWAAVKEGDLGPGMRLQDFRRFPEYFAYLPTLQWLQHYDALLGVQFAYLSYLSGRPYAITQMGGDIWYECSRDDLLGRLQRRAFACASAFLVSNPWSLAFARRYGMHHLVYMPLVMDETRYCPGPASLRAEWAAASGGDFFVLMTSRLDFRFKGSQTGIRAFARLAAQVPGARLLVTGWGADRAQANEMLQSLGIADKVVTLPIAGKKGLVEYLRSAHCIVDQLSFGYYGASALEAMGCGLPVIMHLDRGQYDALLPEGCAPVLQAQTEDEVAAHLLALARDPGFQREAGERLLQWFLRTHSGAVWAERYEAILWGTAHGTLPSFDQAPLRAPLTAAEHDYHAAELAAAPAFPNYLGT